MTDSKTRYGLQLTEIPWISDDDIDDDAEDEEEYVPRLKNNGRIQRRLVNECRDAPILVKGTREETVHGVNTDGTPCSLIIFRWETIQRDLGKRLKSLQIRVVFASSPRPRGGTARTRDVFYDPHVASIAPNGTYGLLETTQQVSTTKGFEGSVQLGFAGQSISAGPKYELTKSLETRDRIVINGWTKSTLSGAEQGDPDRFNLAEWNLHENTNQASGLPSCFHTAVLLERRNGDQGQFTADFDLRLKVDGSADAKTRVKQMFRTIPRDEPIIFDPTYKENGRLDHLADHLGEDDLEEECKFVMYKEAGSKSQGTYFRQ